MDLDGTLNNDQKQITGRTKQALLRAQEKGIRLCLASARPAPGLYRECDELHMREYRGILMSYNGGCIEDAATGSVLYSLAMNPGKARSVLKLLKTLPVTVILDNGKKFFVENKNGYKVQYECQNNRMDCEEVEDLTGILDFLPVKILMSVDPDKITAVRRKIAEQLPEDLNVVQTAPFYLEVIPKCIDKGKGLEKVCQRLGIDSSDSISFGDSENDIPMLQGAGIGVAMGNASENVKKAADMITASNNEDGIAATLTELGILNRLFKGKCARV